LQVESQDTSIEFNPSYVGPRPDVLGLIPMEARAVLDVGCSIGVLGEAIKRRNNARVVGIEMDEAMASEAQQKLDRVIVGDVERMDLREHLSDEMFDCIVFADILEHLRDPWTFLKDVTACLRTSGTIVASLPNIRHVSTIKNLLIKGYWPYRDRGIHDRTHLRFFTLRNIRELFSSANLQITTIRRNYRIIEAPHRLNYFSKYLALPGLKDFLTFQYLIQARKP